MAHKKVFIPLLFEACHLTQEKRIVLDYAVETFEKVIPPVDLYIYLYIEPRNALVRIATRGREGENKITLSYLESLVKPYDTWMHSEKYRTQVWFINASKIDAREIAFRIAEFCICETMASNQTVKKNMYVIGASHARRFYLVMKFHKEFTKRYNIIDYTLPGKNWEI